MEKTTFFNQVPRPPKKIWEDDTAIETVNKNQVLTVENNEKPSVITIAKPKVEWVAGNTGNENKLETIADAVLETKLAAFENKDLDSENINDDVADYLKTEENKDLSDKTDLEIDDPKMERDAKELKNLTPILPKNIHLTEQGNGDVKMPNDEDLFKRQYYTMGEVATMFNANQSQIRFWENEFNILKPKKNKKGDRYFRPEDIKNLQLIHHLLRNKKFTIEGANEYLKNNKQRAMDTISTVESLQQLKSFLIELKANL